MIRKEEILKTLKKFKQEVKKKYKVRELGLFGSYINEKQKESSDIDILVEFDEKADLFDLIRLTLFLEEKLNKKVDIVPKSALREEIKENILQKVIYA